MFNPLLKSFKKRFGENRHYYTILDSIFGIFPNNIELYKLALIHKSASLFLDDGSQINNERLEFLGDAILEAVVSDYLFIEFPDEDEGFLTQMRSKLVSRSALNKLCINIGLDRHIISLSGGDLIQKHLHGDALEAMIGAIYLDKGYNYTNNLIINDIFYKHLDLEATTTTETDFKSRLIEWCQKSKHTISFETLACEESTAHKPVFRSSVMIDQMEVGYGLGSSKKEAEQRASHAVALVIADDIAGDNFMEMIDGDLQRSEGRKRGASKRKRAGGATKEEAKEAAEKDEKQSEKIDREEGSGESQ